MRTKIISSVCQGKYFLAAILAAVIWGFFSIPLRQLKQYPADQILYYRIIFSLIFTWALLLLFRKKYIKADLLFYKSLAGKYRKQLLYLTVSAGILITANWFTFIYAINNVSIKSAAFAYMVCPLITALGGFLFLKEKVTVFKLGGIGIAIISVALLSRGSVIDVVWSILIATLYAFYLIIQRLSSGIDKLHMLGIHLIIATVLMNPIFFNHQYPFPADLYFWLNISLIAMLFTVLPLFLSLYALIGMSSSTMGILIYINPIVAFTVAFVYFDEKISTQQALAYGLLIAGIVVFNWRTIRGNLKENNVPVIN